MSFIPGDGGVMGSLPGSKINSPVKLDFNNSEELDGSLTNRREKETGIIGDSAKDMTETEDSGVYDWIVDIDMISKVRIPHLRIF
jgi:hypothetical protein